MDKMRKIFSKNGFSIVLVCLAVVVVLLIVFVGFGLTLLLAILVGLALALGRWLDRRISFSEFLEKLFRIQDE